jgi:hypothetical protein
MKLKIKVKQVEVINSQYSNLPTLQEIIHWIKSLVEFKVVFKLDQDWHLFVSTTQEYARKHYDTNHRALEFEVGDWVWLRLLNRPTQSLALGSRGKLGPMYAGPYKVLERVGKVAYRLQLPEGARIHDVFHVGVLKPMCGPPPSTVPALPPLRHGRPLLQPDRVLRASLHRGVWHVLVQWADMPPSEATWEQVDEFRAAHPSF